MYPDPTLWRNGRFSMAHKSGCLWDNLVTWHPFALRRETTESLEVH
jgi:hypothetical protein